MKNFILTTALLLGVCSGSLFAQTESEEDNTIEQLEISKDKDGLKVQVQTIDSISGEVKDTTKIKFNKSTVYIVTENNEGDPDVIDGDCEDNDRARLTHWAGLDLGMNGFTVEDGTTNFSDSLSFMEVDLAKSRTFSINFAEHKLRIFKDYFGITTGLGVQWNNYRLKEDYTLVTSKDTLTAFLDTTINVRKNKLRTAYLNVPFLLEFNTSADPDKSVHLSLGVVGGLHLGTMYKQRFERGDVRFKSKTQNFMNIETFKLDAMVRAGYGNFNFFLSTQLTELFKEGTGPQLHPFTAGITIVGFN